MTTELSTRGNRNAALGFTPEDNDWGSQLYEFLGASEENFERWAWWVAAHGLDFGEFEKVVPG